MLSFKRLLRLGIPTLQRFLYTQKGMMAQYRETVQRFSFPYYHLLDAGCGRSSPAEARGRCRLVVGIDTDIGISKNSDIDVAVMGGLSNLPFRRRTFDMIVNSRVVEHLSRPQAVFAEFNRVLKDDGIVILLTPNLLHYATFLTAITPHWFQKWFWVRVLDCKHEEYFPTFYRANTPKKLVYIMRGAGFEMLEMKLIDPGPAFLDWLAPAYAIGLIYHRLVNRFDRLSPFRREFIAVFRKVDNLPSYDIKHKNY